MLQDALGWELADIADPPVSHVELHRQLVGVGQQKRCLQAGAGARPPDGAAIAEARST